MKSISGFGSAVLFLAASLGSAANNAAVTLPSANVTTPVNTVTPAHADNTASAITPNATTGNSANTAAAGGINVLNTLPAGTILIIPGNAAAGSAVTGAGTAVAPGQVTA